MRHDDGKGQHNDGRHDDGEGRHDDAARRRRRATRPRGTTTAKGGTTTAKGGTTTAKGCTTTARGSRATGEPTTRHDDGRRMNNEIDGADGRLLFPSFCVREGATYIRIEQFSSEVSNRRDVTASPPATPGLVLVRSTPRHACSRNEPCSFVYPDKIFPLWYPRKNKHPHLSSSPSMPNVDRTSISLDPRGGCRIRGRGPDKPTSRAFRWRSPR
jgi:hypothetical protein